MLVPSFAPIGGSGLWVPGGRLVRREANRDLATDSRAYGDASQLGIYEQYAKTVPSCAQSVKGAVLPVARAMWDATVTPADGKARDRKGTQLLDPHAEFVRRALFEDLKPGFPRYFREATRTAVVNGHAVSEVVCRYDKVRKQVTLAKLAPRPPWTIYRWVFTAGVLTGIQQRAYGNGSLTSDVIPIDSILVHTLDPSGDDPTGESWLRPCHLAAKLVIDGLNLLGIWTDREALGVPVATVPKGLSVADKEDIDTWLANLRAHENAFGRFPEGVSVEWLKGDPQGGASITAAIDFLDRQIRQTFLQSMQSMGTTPNGSLAAASAMQDPWVLAEEGLAADILEAVNTQLIPALVEWNFGPQPAYPYISAPKLRAEDVAAALKPLTDASAAGLTSKRAATERAHELLGLPAPEAEVAAAPATVPGAAAVADVQETALNGAQLDSLVSLVTQVAAGTLPRDSAVEIVQIGFRVDAATADRLLASAGRGFVPKVEEKPAPASAPTPQLHSLSGCPCGRCEPMLMADGKTHTGVMVAFWPPADVAATLAIPGGLPAEEMHLTLAYIGKEPGLGPKVLAAVEAWAKSAAPCEGEISGTGRFAATESSDGKDVAYLSFDAPSLPEMRHSLCAALDAAGCGPKRNHGFTPHMTLSYVEPGEAAAVYAKRTPLRFAEIVVTVGEANTAFPLAGKPTQTLAEAKPWTPRRPLLAGEGVVRFAEIAGKLDAAPADLAAGVTAAVLAERESVTAWVVEIQRAADEGDFAAVNKADVPPGLRKALTDATAGYASALYAFGREHAEAELALAPGRAEQAARATQAALREEIADPAAEPLKLAAEDEQDDSAAVPLDDPDDPGLDALARGQGDALADEILRTTRAKAIRDAAARKAANLPPVDLDEEKVWNDFVTSVEEAPAIKRTAMELSVEGNSAGRAAFMREAESEGVKYPVLYSALLDSGTCGPCRTADGTIADSVAGADAGQIPASPNPACESTKGRFNFCRCLRVLQPSKQ